MTPSPSLKVGGNPGPVLKLGQEVKPPVLVLNTTSSSPTLQMSAEDLTAGDPFSNTIPALVFMCLGCLVSVVTVPLSQGSEWVRIPVEQLWADVSSIHPPWMAQEEDVLADAESPAQNPADIEVEQAPPALTPFELLSGVSCPAYFPGDQMSASSSAFDEHIWSKLPEQWQTQATERLEVCGPFESVKPDLIVSQGCIENECGTNDVRFFLTSDAKAAVEIYLDGECLHTSEAGFRYKQLLCAPR